MQPLRLVNHDIPLETEANIIPRRLPLLTSIQEDADDSNHSEASMLLTKLVDHNVNHELS
jgi:hypothetical protein